MKILMVCLGNICRSPLAEGIMKHHLDKKGISFFVDSAGTSAHHIGEPPDPRSIDIAKKNGLDISTQKARQLKKEDFNQFDYVFVMDHSNYSDALELRGQVNEPCPVDFIMNLVSPGEDKSVPDPYFGGKDGFESVYRMLDLACAGFASKLNP